MSSELERIDLEGHDLDIDTLRAQLAPGASIPELQHFARVCAALDLSPFAGQIVLVGRRDKRLNRVVFRPQVTVAGRRARAERTGLLDGISDPEWCGPRQYGPAGEKLPLLWEDIWTDEENYPYAARVFVFRKDQGRPSNGTAKWAEFAQYDDAEQTRLGRFWKRMPSFMLAKTAESIALRRAFPDDASYRIAPGVAGASEEYAPVAEATAAELNSGPATDGIGPERGDRSSPLSAEPVEADAVPDDVRDNQPEASAHQPGDGYRYDPADNDPNTMG